ncbi:TPA: hypothetical protein DCQ44_01300 [Candidatus Taylorbacteria bacterium]|nr:hypothetical protein [Candidatus Taylorbacteria bacterium]
MTEQDILNLIEQDAWMMYVINIAAKLELPDWVIGAGFVRNKIWDHLCGHKKEKVDTRDIDLVYFDQNGNGWEADNKLSEELRKKTGLIWEIKNEVYMHERNGLLPYTSTADAISKWPETVTAIGVKLNKEGKLELVAPYGIGDLINFVVRPTPNFRGGIEEVKTRMLQKKWQEKWPKITLVLTTNT